MINLHTLGEDIKVACSMSEAIRSSSLQAAQSLAAGRERRNSAVPSWLSRNHQEIYVAPRRQPPELSERQENADVISAALIDDTHSNSTHAPGTSMSRQTSSDDGPSISISEVLSSSAAENTPSQTTMDAPDQTQSSQVAFHSIALPAFIPSNFSEDIEWGILKGSEITSELTNCYEKIIKWKRNLFLVPSGKIGKTFIAELTRIFDLFNYKTRLEKVSVLAVHVCIPLLLQKPSKKSKSRDHVVHLERRLKLWKDGKFQELLKEPISSMNTSWRGFFDCNAFMAFLFFLMLSKFITFFITNTWLIGFIWFKLLTSLFVLLKYCSATGVFVTEFSSLT